MKINYRIMLVNGSKVIEGQALTGFFAAHRVPMGWKVTHLKSGYALCDPPFESIEAASGFARMIEAAFQGTDLAFESQQIPATENEGVVKNHIRLMLNQIHLDKPEIITADYLTNLHASIGG